MRYLALALCVATTAVADPAPVIGTITKVAPRDAGGSLVSLDKGFNDGVTRHFLGCLLRADNTCIADARLVRVDKTQAVVVIDLAPYRIDPAGRVRLYAP